MSRSNFIERRRKDGVWVSTARDMPTGPEPIPEPAAPPGPDPEPAAPPGPDPGPTPPTGPRPAPYEHRPDLSAAIEADGEALALLARTRGRAALDEASQAIGVLDSVLEALRPRLATPGTAGPVVEQLAAAMRRRGVLAARARALAGILGVDIDPIPDPPPVPRLATIAAAVPPGRTVGGGLADRAGRIRSELDLVEAQLGQLGDLAGSDAHYHDMGRETIRTADDRRIRVQRMHPSDAWLSGASGLTTRRRAMRAELDLVEADMREVTELVASRMAAAVAAAGGPDAVASTLVAAQALQTAVPPPPAELESIDSELARLVEHGAEGDRVQDLRARRAAILDGVAADRRARRVRRRRQAGELVAAAIAGSEGARASIESILTQSPDVAPGLCQAVAAASPDRAILAALAAAV